MTDPDPELDRLFTDRALAELPPVEPSARLLRSVATVPIEHPRPGRAFFWPFETVWRPALGWSLAAVFGLTLGFSTETSAFDPEILTSVFGGDATGDSTSGVPSPESTASNALGRAGSADDVASDFHDFLSLSSSDGSGYFGDAWSEATP